jgi:ATP-dependent protease ClpP protease subunit
MIKAKLVIDGNIGEPDPMLIAFGLEDNTISSQDVANFLLENVDADTIEIEIRSNGGSVSHGFDIYDQLINSGKKIITKGYRVNSIATVIFLAGDKGKRFLSKNAEFIIHNPWISAEQLGAMKLTADSVSNLQEDLQVAETKLFDFYAEKLKLDDSGKVSLREMMGKDTNLGSAEAIKFGFASGYLEDAKVKAVYTDLILAELKSKSNTNNKMDNKVIETKITGLEKLLTKVLNLVKAKVEIVAASINLGDGTPIYYDGELMVGAACFSDEAMTMPLDGGEYPLEDGRILNVDAGIVTEIVEAVADSEAELAALKLKVTELEASLKTESELKNAEVEKNKTVTADVEKITTELTALKTLVIGATTKKEKVKAEVVTEQTPDWKKRLLKERSNRVN